MGPRTTAYEVAVTRSTPRARRAATTRSAIRSMIKRASRDAPWMSIELTPYWNGRPRKYRPGRRRTPRCSTGQPSAAVAGGFDPAVVRSEACRPDHVRDVEDGAVLQDPLAVPGRSVTLVSWCSTPACASSASGPEGGARTVRGSGRRLPFDRVLIVRTWSSTNSRIRRNSRAPATSRARGTGPRRATDPRGWSDGSPPSRRRCPRRSGRGRRQAQARRRAATDFGTRPSGSVGSPGSSCPRSPGPRHREGAGRHDHVARPEAVSPATAMKLVAAVVGPHQAIHPRGIL